MEECFLCCISFVTKPQALEAPDLLQYYVLQRGRDPSQLIAFSHLYNQEIHLQTSQLGRIAHCEILIMVVFRIPLFQEMRLKTLWHQNCCYLPRNFLKDWLSNLNIATEVLELYETCLPQHFCKDNEQLKEVINLIKDLHHRSLAGL